MCRAGARRSLAILLAVALAGPSLGRAAEPAPSDFDREIDALVEQRKYREAAVRLAEKLRQLAETQANRFRRNALASGAVHAYLEAFHAAPDDCALASSGLLVADEYLDGLVNAYGEGVEGSDEFQGMSGLQTEFDRVRAERNCPAPEESPPQLAPTPAQAPAPPPATPNPQTDSGTKRDDRLLVAGVAVSAGLTGAMLAVSLGTGLSRYKEPFRGAAYQKIHDAAVKSHTDLDVGNEVDYRSDTDMCSEMNRENNGDVRDACRRWEQLGTTAIVTGVITGALGVTTIALLAVLVKKRRSHSNAAALLRQHKATLGVSPVGRSGLNVNLGFAF